MKQMKGKTTKQKIDLYRAIEPLLEAMFNEFKELSKKKPDGIVSKDKIRVVNRLLVKCKDVLKDEFTIEFLDIVDEDAVPQNSDIVLMLSQYNAAMIQFFNTYYDRL